MGAADAPFNYFTWTTKTLKILSVGFPGSKFKNWHGGTVLHKYGHVRTKEREVERRQKIGTGEPCHVVRSSHIGTVSCVFGAVRSVAARVCGVEQFPLAARFCLSR